jgi:hypothetical protein
VLRAMLGPRCSVAENAIRRRFVTAGDAGEPPIETFSGCRPRATITRRQCRRLTPSRASEGLEQSARAVYEGPPALGDAIDEVMTLGFDPIGVFPVVRGEGFRVIGFDGLF